MPLLHAAATWAPTGAAPVPYPPPPARRMSFLTAHGPAGTGTGRGEAAEPPPLRQRQHEEVRFLRSHSRRSYSEDVHPWLDPQPVALPRTWGLAPAGRSKTLHFVRHGEGHHVRDHRRRHRRGED